MLNNLKLIIPIVLMAISFSSLVYFLNSCQTHRQQKQLIQVESEKNKALTEVFKEKKKAVEKEVEETNCVLTELQAEVMTNEDKQLYFDRCSRFNLN